MELSLFLAKLFGCHFVVTGIAWLTKREWLKKAVNEALQSHALTLLTGAIAFIGGLAIVIAHHNLFPLWQGSLTLLGVLAMLKGLLHIFDQSKNEKLSRWMIEERPANILSGLLIVWGLWLLYHGFI